MKTLLIVLAIVALLGMVVFILIREHKNVDEEISKPDSDAPEIYEEEDEDEAEVEVAVPEDTDEPEPEAEPEKELEPEPEVNIPEHCKPKEEPVDNLPNKYFFNIHKYTSKRGKQMFCVVCSAVINNENYRIIVKNSYYPYLGSYTLTLMNKIESMFEDKRMNVEEFIKLGSTNFDNLGEIVTSF